MMLCPLRRDEQRQPEEPTEFEINSVRNDKQKLATIRSRLSDISWMLDAGGGCSVFGVRCSENSAESGDAPSSGLSATFSPGAGEKGQKHQAPLIFRRAGIGHVLVRAAREGTRRRVDGCRTRTTLRQRQHSLGRDAARLRAGHSSPYFLGLDGRKSFLLSAYW